METPSYHPDRLFATLWEENVLALYRNALGALGNPAEAEDLVQEVAAEFLNNLRAGKVRVNPRACLFGLLRMRATDHIRRRTRRREIPLEADGSTGDTATLADLLPAPDDVEAQGLEQADDRSWRALQRLSPEQRWLLACHEAGIADEVIAARLGINREAAKKRRQRTLALARRLLVAAGTGPAPGDGAV